LARRRIPVFETVISGARTILGRLAQWFRLGQIGAIQPPLVAEPGRERLETPEQVIEAVRARNLAPPPSVGNRVSWSYECTWYDKETGEKAGRRRIVVETDEGVPYQTAAAQARRDARDDLPACVRRSIANGVTVELHCRRVAAPVIIPASSE
jgi:uncharacterized protein YodC (DUF2158 family)